MQPQPQQPRGWFKPKTMEDCQSRYGAIQFGPDGRMYFPGDIVWIKPLNVPPEVSLNLVNAISKMPVNRIFCNKDMHLPLYEALEAVCRQNLIHELKTFDGCYNVRMVRGSKANISLHSYGLAIDLNASLNPLGSEHSSFSDAFIRCFTDLGWVWGGHFKTRKDPMHFQWFGESRGALVS